MKADMLRPIKIITPDGEVDNYTFSSAVIALGTFDGVHIAHTELVREAIRLKEKINAEAVGAWCFEQSPALLLNGDAPAMLTTTKEKLALLFCAGADFVALAKFEDFRDIDAEDFANEYLISRLSAKGAVCGYDHKFGKCGIGNSTLLEALFGKENTLTVPEITLDGETVSSSAIRKHLRRGELEIANRMLGRCISLTAPVDEGKRLGRRLGFPTANQSFPKGFINLRHGVYATLCIVDGESYIGVSNVGVRPSIDKGDDHKINCETYIIGLSRELYGKVMTVEFCSYLREEKRFSSLDELSLAIECDCAACKEYFSQNKL